MNWLTRILPSIKSMGRKKDIPEGLWGRCDACQATIYRAELVRNLMVCPKCAHHMYIAARKRIEQFLDAGSLWEFAQEIVSKDPLRFRDTKKYKDRLHQAQKKTGEKSALLVFKGTLLGMPIVAGAFEYAFIGGSLGAAVGEKFVKAVNVALEERRPFICFVASGGARMQEGVTALMQMAKVSAALTRLAEARVPYLPVLTYPTMGGVSASLAMLGDILVAEPGALIGFSGPRVIEQTINEKLPEGFQRSEFLLEHGALDMIVDRRLLRPRVAKLVAKLTGRTLAPEVD